MTLSHNSAPDATCINKCAADGWVGGIFAKMATVESKRVKRDACGVPVRFQNPHPLSIADDLDEKWQRWDLPVSQELKQQLLKTVSIRCAKMGWTEENSIATTVYRDVQKLLDEGRVNRALMVAWELIHHTIRVDFSQTMNK